MHATHPIARRTAAAAAIVAVSFVALACTLTPAGAQASTSPPAGRTFDGFMSSQGFKSWTTVRAIRGNSAPRYPDQLRANATEGAVLASFVVDTSGRVDAGTIRILESTNDAFTTSVRAALPSMAFVAAEVDGRKVKQLVQLPFVFGVGDHAVLPAAIDTAHTTTRCEQGSCPVYRLGTVVTTIAR